MWDIRTLSPEDVDLFRGRLARGFGQDGDPEDDAARERFEAIFEYDRTFAVFDGDDIIGTGGAFSFDLTVPGGRGVPMGGTTIITVQPTHRRRGVLRELMRRHLDDVADRGEPLAGLWASEASIYGRFGYGQASFRHITKIEAKAVAFREPPPPSTRVRLVEPEAAAEVLPKVYEAVRLRRPGMLTRSRQWWTHRRLADPESSRDGKSARRYVVSETDGEVTGYAVYRQDAKWDDFVADGEVELVEVITIDSSAHRAIWSFLTNIDLFPRVSWWNLPVDDPMSESVTDSRKVRRTLSDALWIRLMDVSAALEARSYEQDGTLAFSVEDATRPKNSGTYRLEVRDGEARCTRTGDPAELSLDVEALGHIYLGGGDARVMAAAGRIDGGPEPVTTLHGLFRADLAPWCPEVF
jgi:predicted acetyltransferase